MQDLQQTLVQALDYVKGVWIKKRYVMIFSWLICPLGFIYVYSLPDEYSSESRVYVDTQSVLQPLLKGLAIQNNPRQEIQMMTRTLLSRSNVEMIARESDLDLQANTSQEFDLLVKELGEEIKLSGTTRSNIYTISYTHPSPTTAQKVVQETLDLLVEGTLGNSRRDTDTAERFINEQIAEYENRLSEAEQRLANFKRQYNDVLPLAGSFYGQIQKLDEQLAATRLEIKQTQKQVSSLRAQLSGSSSPDSFGVTNNEEDPMLRTRYDERIRALEEELDRLQLRFTDKHPDVIETKALLASLEESRKKEINAFLQNDENGTSQPMNELSRQIRLEVSRLESLIASLEVKEEDIIAKRAELESKIDLIPQIEAESAALNRDYKITKDKYEQLLSRRESADLSRRADVSAEDFQFRIIEPPMLPIKPSGPKRLIFYTAVLFLGFGVGIGIAFLVSQITPVIVRPKQLLQITNLPVWGSVSHLNIASIHRKNRIRLVFFVLSTGIIFAMYGALMAAEVMNIDLLGVIYDA
ncbi:XrtA system polysaccharide chain length determinant [Alteromonas halophila]|uniref:Chain-length determining protein n=1 Tax=Alteromonas halophila TaxID=516698 RepID=A0A918MYQ9_9ALTE|nr:XrtA system polysaccharide chain length determinant [Alteromonas halophila]GGW87073.1 hypothetical protein GCM10007391_21120 [Alteromonas halophila]